VNVEQLEKTALELVASGKGILAADESFGTIEKRFNAVGIESTEESRRDYREMLFTTPDVGEFLSGVILFDETVRQGSSDGTLLPEILNSQGIIPGIKVDRGAKDMALSPGEKVTEGLDGLGGRSSPSARASPRRRA
jgi:fructose-bisphosphate aldolase class I